jgi:DNA transformation protein and related proteins
MAISKDFADYCCELLSGVGKTTAKRMFGGWGIYVDGVTIAVIADLTKLGGANEKLYLKVDDVTKQQFEAAGGKRFEMESKDGKPMGMNYYTTPDETMESSDAMLPWARMALLVAMDAKVKVKVKAKVKAKPKPKAKTKAPVATKTAKVAVKSLKNKIVKI